MRRVIPLRERPIDWLLLGFFWSGVMFANVSIIMFEELFGPNRTPAPLTVTLANVPWWILPLVVTWRFARSEDPFTEEAAPT